MNEIAWYPKGMAMPTGLTAVWVKPGKMSHQIWMDALADRLVNLLLKEDEADQMPLAEWACDLLEVPSPDYPNQIDQCLLEGNETLQSLFNLAVIDQDPFEEIAKQEEVALEVMEETDFSTWVELAAAEMNPHDLL